VSGRRPRVSVLLPVRDAAATLEPALRSLRRQTLRDHEVVAVDDGSSDDSAALLERAAARDPRVVVVHTPPRGLVAALNTALEHARAPLLARMDADDVAHALRLELQAGRLFADGRVSVLGCRVRHGAAAGLGSAGMAAYVRWSNSLLRHAEIARDVLVESPLVHPSVMVRAALLRRLGGYRDFDGPEDYDLWLRALAAGARFAKLPQALLLWRDSPARLTRRDPRYEPPRFLDLKLQALERARLVPSRPLVIWGAGRAGKAWARALLARGHQLAGFVEVDPRKLGQRIHGAPVWPCAAAGQVANALHLAAVPQPDARARIRAEAARHGLREGRDLVAVA
jgi:cellulose synthase/poly-beta-1,6-N-acetylglucosamine synthase-like glycosyltransferase